MDRLLVVTPRELRFAFEPGKKAIAKIRLHNLMHTMPVAFKVLTTASKKYTVSSQAIIIPPLGEHVVEVVMAPQNSFPDSFPISQDKFFVKTLMLPTGKATQAELNLWFSTRKKHVFNDATLKVILTGPFVLCRLAMSGGSSDSIKEVLRDTLVNARDGQDRTALFLATIQGNLDVVQTLIERKADANIKDRTGLTPLFEAAIAGQSEIVKALLDAGAANDHKDSRGWTSLHAAAAWNHTDIISLLLDAGAHIDAATERERTPLHEAADAGHFEAVALLVQRGADLERRCINGTTALHIAASSGFEDIADFLLQEGSDMHARSYEGKTPYDLARANGHSRFLDSSYLQELLQQAARKNNPQTVQDCLLQGAATDATDQHGWTALHRASFKGYVNVVTLLLKHQFDVDAKDEKGYTPLHCAVEAGHKEVVELLLQHGADVNMTTNKGGLTPLALAFTRKYSRIRQLIEEAKPAYCKCK